MVLCKTTNIHMPTKINKTYSCGLGILESKSDKSSNKLLNYASVLIKMVGLHWNNTISCVVQFFRPS